MFRALYTLLMIILLLYAEADAQSSSPPQIGLALSGGGACGIAHIGILKALEEGGIPIHMIAGVSMGSLVGGLYAAGHTPAEIQAATDRVNWSDIFRDTPRRSSLFRGKKPGPTPVCSRSVSRDSEPTSPPRGPGARSSPSFSGT